MKQLFLLLFCLLLLFTSPQYGFTQTIKFGISSMLSPGETLSYYTKLNDYIADKLLIPVTMIHESNYAAMNRHLENQKVHFASICSGALLDLKVSSYNFLAIPVVRGKSTYQSYIIANRKSKIHTLADITPDTIFGLTDQLSNTGALYPRYLFAKRGTALEMQVKKIYFTGSHDNSIFLINRGVIDAAAVDNLIFMHMKEETPESVSNIVVIHKSPSFPIPPIVASTKLSDKLYKQLQTILTNMHLNKKGKEILNQLKIDRFIVPESMNYEIMKEMKLFIDENTHSTTPQNTSK